MQARWGLAQGLAPVASDTLSASLVRDTSHGSLLSTSSVEAAPHRLQAALSAISLDSQHATRPPSRDSPGSGRPFVPQHLVRHAAATRSSDPLEPSGHRLRSSDGGSQRSLSLRGDDARRRSSASLSLLDTGVSDSSARALASSHFAQIWGDDDASGARGRDMAAALRSSAGLSEGTRRDNGELRLLIGRRRSVGRLVALFSEVDESTAAKLSCVSSLFPDYRSVAGDGNCFYRRCVGRGRWAALSALKAALGVRIVVYRRNGRGSSPGRPAIWPTDLDLTDPLPTQLPLLAAGDAAATRGPRGRSCSPAPSDFCGSRAEQLCAAARCAFWAAAPHAHPGGHGAGARGRCAVRRGALLPGARMAVTQRHRASPPTNSQENLVRDVNATASSDAMVQFLRCVTAQHMLTERDAYAPFLGCLCGDGEGEADLNAAMERSVTCMGADAEHPMVLACAAALRCAVAILYVAGEVECKV